MNWDRSEVKENGLTLIGKREIKGLVTKGIFYQAKYHKRVESYETIITFRKIILIKRMNASFIIISDKNVIFLWVTESTCPSNKHVLSITEVLTKQKKCRIAIR